MREIKFRGLRTDGKGWIFGDLKRVNDTRFGGRWTYIWVDTDEIEDEGEYIQVEPHTVGQFTGRKDINNIEIFEGDKILHGESERFIEYRGTNFCATRLEKTESILLSFCKEPQIIGNIHEAP